MALLLVGCKGQEPLVVLPSAERIGELLFMDLNEDLKKATTASTAAESAGALGRLGMRLAAHGVLDTAARSFELASELSPDVFEWQYLAGYVAFEEGAMHLAADTFRRACDLNLESVACASRLVQSLLQVGDIGLANEELEARLGTADDVAYVRLLRGDVARAKGDWETTSREYRAALDLQPEAIALKRSIARCEQMLGRADAARALLGQAGAKRVTLSDPWVERMMTLDQSPTTLMERGGEALANGNVVEAKMLFKEASRRGPTDPAGPYNLGVVLLQQGGAESAARRFREALTRDRNHFGSLVSLAGLMQRRGELEEAIGLLERAEAGHPSDSRVLLRLGSTLLRAGRPEEALDRFETVLDKGGSETTERAALGAATSASRAGDDGRALEIARGGCLHECGVKLRVALIRLLAASRVLEDRDSPAAVAMAQRLRKESSDAEVAFALSMALAAHGEFESAIELQRALLQAAQGAGQSALVTRVEHTLQENAARQKPNRPGL